MVTAFEVSLVALRRALRAVRGYAGEPDSPGLCAVWFMPGEDLQVYAASERAAALAVVPLSFRSDDSAEAFLIAPEDARRVLAVFPQPKRDEEGSAVVRIDFPSEREVRFTDASRLLDGVSLVCVALRSEVGDVRSIMARAVRAAVYSGDAGTFLLGEDLRLLRAVSDAYGLGVHLGLTRPGAADGERSRLVVTVGESFVGVHSSAVIARDSAGGVAEVHGTWEERLAGVGADPFRAKDRAAGGGLVDYDEVARWLQRLAGLPVEPRGGPDGLTAASSPVAASLEPDVDEQGGYEVRRPNVAARGLFEVVSGGGGGV